MDTSILNIQPLSRLATLWEVILIFSIILEIISVILCLIAIYIRYRKGAFSVISLVKLESHKIRFIKYNSAGSLNFTALMMAALLIPYQLMILANVRGESGIASGRQILSFQVWIIPGIYAGWGGALGIVSNRLGELRSTTTPKLCTNPILSNVVALYPVLLTVFLVPLAILSNKYRNESLNLIEIGNSLDQALLNELSRKTVNFWRGYCVVYFMGALGATALMIYLISCQYSSSSFLVFKVPPIIGWIVLPCGVIFSAFCIVLVCQPVSLMPASNPISLYIQTIMILTTALTQIFLQSGLLYLSIILKVVSVEDDLSGKLVEIKMFDNPNLAMTSSNML